MPPLFVTSVHTPDPCLPAPVAPSLSKAWRGQTPSDPPRQVPHLAPLPLWCPHCRHDDETALDASLHHSGLAAVGLLFAFEWINWRCWRSKDEVSSVKDKWSGKWCEKKRKVTDEQKIWFLYLTASWRLVFFLFLTSFCALLWNPSHQETIKINCSTYTHKPKPRFSVAFMIIFSS